MNCNYFILTAFLFASTATTFSQQKNSKMTPKDTEVWEPIPPIVSTFKDQAPSDAIVLFDGTDLNAWEPAKKPGEKAEWLVGGGTFTVNKAAGNIQTKQKFEDYQLHLEYYIPKDIDGEGQGRGNSGLFLASTGPNDEGYEMQILDSYNNKTYSNGQLGAIYKQVIPLANPAKQPGEWQTIDVVWTAPKFNSDGSLKSPASVTSFINGVLMHNNVALKGETLYIGHPSYKAHGPSSIKLQSHGDPSKPISFRNIWVRELNK